MESSLEKQIVSNTLIIMEYKNATKFFAMSKHVTIKKKCQPDPSHN